MIVYILESMAFQLVFLLLFDLLLRKETFFQWNRIYLIGTPLLSLLLPKAQIPWLQTSDPSITAYYPKIWTDIENPVISTTSLTNSPTGENFEWGVVIGGTGMFIAILFFCYKLYQILQLRKNGERTVFPKYERVVVAQSSIVFTFFKSVFMGDEVLAEKYKNILDHELVHVRQWHSLDMLFFEVLRIFYWFNPMVYWYQNRMRELHEFIADDAIMKQDRGTQYELLLSQAFQTQHISFLNHFYRSSLVKRRIQMLRKEGSHNLFRMKYMLLMPILLLMLCYTSCESEILKEDLQLPFAGASSEVQNESDEVLFQRIKAKVLQEIENKVADNALTFKLETSKKFYSDELILSKEDFFEYEIWKQTYLLYITAKFNSIETKRKLAFSQETRERIEQMPSLSTVFYNSYVQRKKAFKILDKNLKISLKDYGVTPLYDNLKTESQTLFKVADTRDLTGDEVRALNRRLTAVFEDSDVFSKMIITDGHRKLLVFKGEI